MCDPDRTEPEWRGLSPEKAFDYTAQQIDHEVQRANDRVKRFLTFNGFLFASLALAARLDAHDPVRDYIMLVLPVAGVIIALTTFVGVLSAQMARDDIKEYWEKDYWKDKGGVQTGQFPPLYSKGKRSKAGRYGTLFLIALIGLIWVGLPFVAG